MRSKVLNILKYGKAELDFCGLKILINSIKDFEVFDAALKECADILGVLAPYKGVKARYAGKRI